MANVLQDVMGQYNLGNQMWTNFMKQMQGIQQGQLSPQELPMFKQLQAYINKMGQTSDQNLMRELTSRGITGGALEQAMRQSQEQRNKGLLEAINQIYGQSGQMIPQVAQQGMDPFWKMAALWSQRKNRQQQQSQWKTQMWMEGLSKALQVGASAAAGGMGAAGMGTPGGTSSSPPMGGNTDFTKQFQNYPWSWGTTW